MQNPLQFRCRVRLKAQLMSDKIDILGIGNAIVDVIGPTDDAFLVREAILKGAMNLIDEARAEHLLQQMPHALTISGGSAANTTVGVADLGASAAYIGKVKADAVGAIFSKDIQDRRQVRCGLCVRRARQRPFVYFRNARRRTINEHLSGSLPKSKSRGC